MEAVKRIFKCLDCGEEFEKPFGIPRWNIVCPKCGSSNIVRIDNNCGRGGRGWGRGQGRWKNMGWEGGRGRGRGMGWGRGGRGGW